MLSFRRGGDALRRLTHLSPGSDHPFSPLPHVTAEETKRAWRAVAFPHLISLK